MGRHGLPNFLVLREGLHPGDGIRWRRQHRQVHRYHAAGAERLPCGRESDCEARGPLSTPGGPILQQDVVDAATAVPRCTTARHGPSADRAQHASTPAPPVPPAPRERPPGSTSNGLRARSSPVAAEHSPSQPFLVSSWVGAQALTGHHGQP
jgi:hypothetical protein